MTGARRQAVLVVWGIAIVAVYCYGGVMVVLCCMAHGYVDGSRRISGNAMCACLSMSHVSCIVAADVMWDVLHCAEVCHTELSVPTCLRCSVRLAVEPSPVDWGSVTCCTRMTCLSSTLTTHWAAAYGLACPCSMCQC